MKTTITITGGTNAINSTSILAGAIKGEIETRPLRFGNDQVKVFKTKKQAVKALSAAFQSLKSEEPEYYKDGCITYSRGSGMSYDAGNATINSI